MRNNNKHSVLVIIVIAVVPLVLIPSVIVSVLRSEFQSAIAANETNPLLNASNVLGNIVKIPIDINQFSKGWSVSNVMLYLNSTDGHYHLKGMLKNTLPETRSGFESILVSFDDKTTNSTVDTESGSINVTMDPGTSVPFDIPKMYTMKQANQFKFMKATITP